MTSIEIVGCNSCEGTGWISGETIEQQGAPCPDCTDGLREALRKLRNEVEALRAFEPQVREIIGNTNWECLFARVAIADSILSSTPRG
jgi:hypothetical protein